MDSFSPKTYEEAIQLMCEELIKAPERLKVVLKNYDSLVKQKIEKSEEMELPYWCYGWGKSDE